MRIDLASPADPPPRILRGRYRRTILFAAWLFARVLFWELILRRVRGEVWVARRRAARLRGWAREFRDLATEMGGVMIKLGQFISSRLDVLPPEVIEELAALQDEVPTVPFDHIRQTLVEDLGPPEERFTTFDARPIAAASLGQAHRAHLPTGDRVVVKVQRPGIRTLVHTDLAALAVVSRWAMRFGFIARRADVPALLDEFSATLWEELDYTHEADNAERFARMFADNKGIYIPRVYCDYTTRRVVALEDVSAIKISDYAAIEAAGIDRRDVARRLINTYLWMVFDQRFFHADPHPGNLFVYPLDPDTPSGSGYGTDGQPLHGRPFYLIFVDFGMAGHLTPAIETGLREALIALVSRDASRLIAAYQELGVILPGADMQRLEEATRAVFDRVWGMNMSELKAMQYTEMAQLGREFSDLLFTMPFQVPQDFILLARAVGILSGLCMGLNPDFDPWTEVAPFAQSLLAKQSVGLPPKVTLRDLLDPATVRALLEDDRAWLLTTGSDLLHRAIRFPVLAEEVLTRARRGDLVVQAAPNPLMERYLNQVRRAAQRVVSAMVFAGLSISGAVLYTSGETVLGTVGLALSGLALLRVVWGPGGR